MEIFDPKLASGDIFVLARTNPNHFGSRKEIDAHAAGLSPYKQIAAESITGSTGEINIPFDVDTGRQLENASVQNSVLAYLETVNQHQQEPERLGVQAIIDPDSVDAHDISIAASKAQMSLNIAKNVVDRVIQAYMSIINTR